MSNPTPPVTPCDCDCVNCVTGHHDCCYYKRAGCYYKQADQIDGVTPRQRYDPRAVAFTTPPPQPVTGETLRTAKFTPVELVEVGYVPSFDEKADINAALSQCEAIVEDRNGLWDKLVATESKLANALDQVARLEGEMRTEKYAHGCTLQQRDGLHADLQKAERTLARVREYCHANLQSMAERGRMQAMAHVLALLSPKDA